MARKNKPDKTKYQNIYEIKNSANEKEYLARWSQNGRQYTPKNLTRLFGSKTAKMASDKLDEIKVLISKGDDPFRKNDNLDLERTLTELVLSEIKDRPAGDDYKYIQEKSYLKYIDPALGKKKLSDLHMDDFIKLFRKLKNIVSQDTIINLKKTINPTLDNAVDEKLIEKNPLQTRRLKKLTKTVAGSTGKTPLKHRLSGIDDKRYIDVARKFYASALTVTKEDLGLRKGGIPDNEIQIVLLLVLMTARRRLEILNIEYSDITKYGTVKTRAETTKTTVQEEYPLPQEVLERLEKNGAGKILPTLTTSTYSNYMRKFINMLDISLHNDAKLDGHDTRNLFLTIMSKETKNPFLCDAALSHSKSDYKMLLTYYEPDLSDFIKLFEHYWDLLRGKRELSG